MKSGVLVMVGVLVAISALMGQEKKDDGKVEVKIDLPRMQQTCPPMRIPAGATVKSAPKAPREPLKAPPGTKNIALKKKVTSSDNDPWIGSLEMITDGEKEGGDAWVGLGRGLQWVQVDLGETATIYGLLVWHFHDFKIYRDVIFQISDDKDFKTGVVTVFNNDQDNSAKLGAGKDFEYFELAEGLLVDCQKIDPKGVKGRYVRCYSNGSFSKDRDNDYFEVEVYGIFVK